MRAFIFHFFDPFPIIRLEGIICKILVGSLSLATFETIALYMPLIASGQTLIVEWRSKFVYSFMKDMSAWILHFTES